MSLETSEEGYSSMLEPEEGETWVHYWLRVNKEDRNSLRLFCQSCCSRYSTECLFKDTLHPYDRSAETCPDYIPRGKPKSKSMIRRWEKRLTVDPEYSL